MNVGVNVRSLAPVCAATLLAAWLLACGHRDAEVAVPAEAPATNDDAETVTNPPATPGNNPDTDTTPGGIAGETEPGSTPTPEPPPQ